MTIVVYSDVILDECVFLAGAQGRVMRQNDRSVNQGGYETVNAVRDISLQEYSFGAKPMLSSEWAEVRAVYEVTDAGAFGFLILDPTDQVASAGSGGLQGYALGAESGVPGFGNGGPLYGLRKVYQPLGSSRTKARTVTRPVAAPVLTRGGSPVSIGVAAGNAGISAAPVYITFVADASQALTSVTPGASTVLNFADGTGIVAAMAVGQRVYLAGLSGTAAATLNGLSHVITAKGATSLTVSTVTTGLSATGGTAYKYPQADEALAWTGRFYVPVHFRDDDIGWDIVRPGAVEDRLVAGPSVVLTEVREA